jgi:hypothetical protein
LVMVSAEVSGPKSGRARVCFVGRLARAQELVAAPATAAPADAGTDVSWLDGTHVAWWKFE